MEKWKNSSKSGRNQLRIQGKTKKVRIVSIMVFHSVVTRHIVERPIIVEEDFWIILEMLRNKEKLVRILLSLQV
jgi:hypothetical protein